MNIPSISNNILELYPVLIPGWITPIKPADRADGGIPKSIYDGNPLGLQVVIDPWTERQFFQDPKAEFDSVALYLNDDEPPVASHTVQPGDEHKRIPLYVPHKRLKHGTNRLYYVVTRLGGHPQPSRDLDVLYHLQGPIDLVLEIPGDVVTDGISAERAAQGVKFTFKYTGPELYDLMRLQIGNHAFDLEVTHPGGEVSMTLYTADFEKTGDGKLTVYFRVTDQLGNFEISDSTALDIHLAVPFEPPAPTVRGQTGNTFKPTLPEIMVLIPGASLLPDDKLSVQWTGATAAAGGSYTSPLQLVSEGLQITVPLSVLAFSLGKTVTVTYTVIRNAVPRISLPLLLNIEALPDSSLILPVILDADNNGAGPQFDVSKLTANATYRMGVWPLIATGQYVWLRLKGTNADGSDYNLQIHTAPGSMVSDKWLDQGYYERSIAFAGLRNLKDGSTLRMEFKAALGKSTNESEAVPFPVRTYTIRAIRDAQLTFVNQPYLKKYNDLVEDIVLSSRTTQGAPAPNEKITLNLPAGFTYADNGNGSRDFWTDNNGILIVSGVKAKGNPGTYNLIAFSGTNTATGRLTIVGYTEMVRVLTPIGIAITLDGLRVLTITNSSTIGVYDSANLALIKTTILTDYPTHAAITPNSLRAFLTSRNVIFVIDMLNLSVIKTIGSETIHYPTGVAITPDGAHAFVSSFSGSSVSVINIQSLSVIKTIFIGINSRPTEIAITPDGKQAFVIDSFNQSVSIIDTDSFLVIKTIALLTQGSLTSIGITPDGLHAFVVASTANKVIVIDVPDQSVKKTLSVMRGSRNIAIAPEGRHVFLTSHGSYSAVSVIDTVSLEMIVDASLPAMGVLGIAITPDGTRAIACNNSYLTVIAAG